MHETVPPLAFHDDIHPAIVIDFQNGDYPRGAPYSSQVAACCQIDPEFPVAPDAFVDEGFVPILKNVQRQTRLWKEHYLEREQGQQLFAHGNLRLLCAS
jgi:hypothetical protein